MVNIGKTKYVCSSDGLEIQADSFPVTGHIAGALYRRLSTLARNVKHIRLHL